MCKQEINETESGITAGDETSFVVLDVFVDNVLKGTLTTTYNTTAQPHYTDFWSMDPTTLVGNVLTFQYSRTNGTFPAAAHSAVPMRAWKTNATNSNFGDFTISSSDILWCLKNGTKREAYLIITPSGGVTWLLEKRGYNNANVVNVLSALPSASGSGGVMLSSTHALTLDSITDSNNLLTDVLQTYNVKSYA